MVILYNRRYYAAENKGKSVIVLDIKRYELEHTSPNIHKVVYSYIANTKIFVIRLDLQKVNDVK